MPLKDIKVYLEQRTPNMFLALLEEKEKEVQREIKQLMRTQDYIHTMRLSTMEALSSDPLRVELRHMPAARLLTSCNVDYMETHTFRDFTKEYVNFFNRNALSQVNRVGSMIRIQDLYEEEYANFTCLYVKTKKRSGQNVFLRQAGNYLITYHHGAYDQIAYSYKRLLQHAFAQHIQLKEFAYEEYLLADIAEKDETNYITMIMVETR